MMWFRLQRTIKLAASSLWMHRLRSTLTTLGIIFGVCSVIAMLAIGEGASREAQAQYGRLGTRNIIVETVKPAEDRTAVTQSSAMNEYGLTYDDAEKIHDTIADARVVVPLRRLVETLWYRNRKAAVEVVGTVPWYVEIHPVQLWRGRFLGSLDLKHQHDVCIIDRAVYETLYLVDEPLGTDVKIAGEYYRVVGVVETSAGVNGSGSDAQQGRGSEQGGVTGRIYLPLTTVRQRFGELNLQITSGSRQIERVELQQITVQVPTIERVPAIRDVVDTLLGQTHKKKDYRIIVPLELLREAARSKRIFSIVLGSIAAISLLVGGIGIMNIMLATVSERTREIGIRRALGAKRRDIVVQFLSETVLLTMVGGVLGILLGSLIPIAVEHYAQMPTVITGVSLLLSFGISGGIGITFGLYPAWRAAQMDPIESLRHE